MNRDKLPLPEKLPDSTSSSDTVINQEQQQQEEDHGDTNDSQRNIIAGPQADLDRQLSSTSYKLTEHDIICGRGRGSFLHEGNKRYIAFLRQNIDPYLAAKKRIDKGVVINSVVSSLKERGFRFLKQRERNEGWCELSDAECYDRTAHAIRDLIRKKKGKNARKLSSKTASRSSSPIDSDSSVTSVKAEKTPSSIQHDERLEVDIPLAAAEQTTSTFANNFPLEGVDSFDEQISQIPSEVMSPTDTLMTNGFDIFFEMDPDDFGRRLAQLDTEKQRHRDSWESHLGS